MNPTRSTLPFDAGDGLLSPRLALRRYGVDDLPELHRLNSDPEVMQYLGGAISEDATRRMLVERILVYYDAHPGLGVWRTLERGSGRCIGFHLLNHMQGSDVVQVGYRLFPEFWGQGYATEMCSALLNYGYRQLELPLITANAQLQNLGSQRVLLKAGLFRRASVVFEHPAYAAYGDLAYFERDGESWLRAFGYSMPQMMETEH